MTDNDINYQKNNPSNGNSNIEDMTLNTFKRQNQYTDNKDSEFF